MSRPLRARALDLTLALALIPLAWIVGPRRARCDECGQHSPCPTHPEVGW